MYSERELQSRYNILCESYVKTVTIEAKLTVMMAKTMILPAALRYQAEVAQRGHGDEGGRRGRRRRRSSCSATLTATITSSRTATATLDKALDHHADGDAYAHAKYARDAILPAMAELRTRGDKLETLVADDLWPLPTYREMLFIK